MATMPRPFVTHETSHEYHAEANVLHGHLKLPLNQEIHQQVPVLLKDRRAAIFSSVPNTIAWRDSFPSSRATRVCRAIGV